MGYNPSCFTTCWIFMTVCRVISQSSSSHEGKRKHFSGTKPSFYSYNFCHFSFFFFFSFFQFRREMLPAEGNRHVRSVWWKESLCRASHCCRKARQPSTLMRQSKLLFKVRCGFHGSDGPLYSAELQRMILVTSQHDTTLLLLGA